VLPDTLNALPETSAKAGGVFHRFHEVPLQKWLSNERKPAALRLPPRQHNHLQSFADPHGGSRQFVSAHAGHIDVGDQNLDAVVSRELVQGLVRARCCYHLSPEVFQHGLCDLEDKRFVIDNKYDARQGTLHDIELQETQQLKAIYCSISRSSNTILRRSIESLSQRRFLFIVLAYSEQIGFLAVPNPWREQNRQSLYSRAVLRVLSRGDRCHAFARDRHGRIFFRTHVEAI